MKESIKLLEDLICIDSSTVVGANRAIEFCRDYLEKQGVTGTVVESEGVKSYIAII